MSNVKSQFIWRNPRQSIACVYKDNDMAYQCSGAHAASFIVKECLIHFQRLMLENFKQNPSGLFVVEDIWREKSILDIGCGTGRITRVLSFFFKKTFGYDPIPETIALANIECLPMSFSGLSYGTELPDSKYSASCCVNVIEHLTVKDQIQVLKQLTDRTEKNGPIVIWLHTGINKEAVQAVFGPMALHEYRQNPPSHIVKTFKNI